MELFLPFRVCENFNNLDELLNIKTLIPQTRSKKEVPDTTTQLGSLKVLVLHLVLLLLLPLEADLTQDQHHHLSDQTLDQTLDHSVDQAEDHSAANQDHILEAMTVH